jgi:hypothetical protein
VTLDLMLFGARRDLIGPAERGGVAGVIVDWERIGKEHRQRGADTLISADTHEDLVAVRATTRLPVICRLDGPGHWTAEEIERAIAAGADEVLLPMVRSPDEVEHALRAAGGRAGVGILIETREALACARELAALPIRRVYVGLHDLAIERGSDSLFTALADGTVEHLRAEVAGVPFGFGGLTLPERGSPVPSRLLLGELVRLRADFTFLRRSFWRDVDGIDAAEAVRSIRAAARRAATRTADEIEADRAELVSVLLGVTA